MGIDDYDDFEDVYEDDNQEVIEDQVNGSEEDLIGTLLKSRNISDRSRIKFEDEYGLIEERDWEDLSFEEKVNVLNSNDPEVGLDDDEINLLNTIRASKMTPAEYLQHITNQAMYSAQQQAPDYQVDSYSDDELFVMDLISKSDNLITNEEALEALDKAKSNPTLYAKQVNATRNEYRQAEASLQDQRRAEIEYQNQQYYQQFANQIANSISRFSNVGGYDLNMDNQDMDELYNLLVGVDAAGNNHFQKLLQNPEKAVRMAWFATRGEEAIDEITKYYNKVISDVRERSYKKGLEDARSKPNMVYLNKLHPDLNLDGYDLDELD